VGVTVAVAVAEGVGVKVGRAIVGSGCVLVAAWARPAGRNGSGVDICRLSEKVMNRATSTVPMTAKAAIRLVCSS
jgi:hypothetical protein